MFEDDYLIFTTVEIDDKNKPRSEMIENGGKHLCFICKRNVIFTTAWRVKLSKTQFKTNSWRQLIADLIVLKVDVFSLGTHMEYIFRLALSVIILPFGSLFEIVERTTYNSLFTARLLRPNKDVCWH